MLYFRRLCSRTRSSPADKRWDLGFVFKAEAWSCDTGWCSCTTWLCTQLCTWKIRWQSVPEPAGCIIPEYTRIWETFMVGGCGSLAPAFQALSWSLETHQMSWSSGLHFIFWISQSNYKPRGLMSFSRSKQMLGWNLKTDYGIIFTHPSQSAFYIMLYNPCSWESTVNVIMITCQEIVLHSRYTCNRLI